MTPSAWAPVQRARNRGSHLEIGPRCDGAEPAPHEAGGRLMVDPRVEVVGSEDDIKTHLLGEHGLIDQDLGLE